MAVSNPRRASFVVPKLRMIRVSADLHRLLIRRASRERRRVSEVADQLLRRGLKG